MIHLRNQHAPVSGLVDNGVTSPRRALFHLLDARALLFGVLATMGSLLWIALGNELAMGAGSREVALAFVGTTVVGALVGAVSGALAAALARRAGLDARCRVAARYEKGLWLGALVACAVVLRALFTDGVERWTFVAAAAGFALAAALGTVTYDARRRSTP